MYKNVMKWELKIHSMDRDITTTVHLYMSEIALHILGVSHTCQLCGVVWCEIWWNSCRSTKFMHMVHLVYMLYTIWSSNILFCSIFLMFFDSS